MGDDTPPRSDALYRAESVRSLDRTAIEEFGVPGIELMERAGAAAWAAFARRWPEAWRVAVLCGPGNNGGDGYVVARRAAEAGVEARAFALGDPARLRGDAATARDRWTAGGGVIEPVAALDPAAWDAAVDGLFGTGLARPPEGDAADAIAAVNAVAGPHLALDIPSGLDADTGNVLGTAVRADLTVTFIGLKQGLLTGDARDLCGEVLLAGLDVPDAVYARVPPDAFRASLAGLGAALGGPRARRAHKGRFGHVLVVGGDHGFAGAARLCAEAAARVGAGLTSVATRHEHVPAVIAARPELMARGVAGSGDLAPLLEAASVAAVGPGLGRAGWGTELLGAALGEGRALVLDADALNLLAAMPALRERLDGARCVITPHPGEAARLLDTDSRSVEADRFAAAEGLCERLACTVVLKGAGTLVKSPGRAPRVVAGGNPGMASGGMGDVLTGVIAGLMVQGLAPADAAVVGAVVHAAAGDAAARDGGERGLLAGDLLPRLRRIVSGL